jgi:hypothetical protein
MNEGNYEVAEDALHVLSESGDDVAYKAGYGMYVKGLHGYKQAEKTTCNAQVKLASSKYMICSHTSLPIHEVYQDERGACRPLYRKRIEESSEGSGASFIQSRVYFE